MREASAYREVRGRAASGTSGRIDAHMQVLPAHAAGVGLAGSIARDAVSGADKPPELLDVEMNHVARVITDIPLQGGIQWFRQAIPA